MKTEKMIMARFALKYGEASKIVKEARANLGIPPSCAWTEELEAEAFRLCGGESDNGNQSSVVGVVDKGSANHTPHNSLSTTTTTSSADSTTLAPSAPAPPSTTTVSTSANHTPTTKMPPPQHKSSSENIGCWTPSAASHKGRVSIGSKHVADLQHETLLEGAEVRREAPKIPVRKNSNANLDEHEVMDQDAGAADDEIDSDDETGGSSDYDDEDEQDMPMPVIRPLRRTDSRTKHA